MVIPILVTVDMALVHLRLTLPAGSPTSDAERDLQQKIDAATAAVCRYIARPTTEAMIEAWTAPGAATGSPDTTAPADVIHAILIELGDLWRDRGDDAGDMAPRALGALTPAAVALVYRFRDPVLA